MSALVTCSFFLVMEFALAIVGVRPGFGESDPFVGFSSYNPLFVKVDEQVEDGPPVMVTAENKRPWFNAQRFTRNKSDDVYRVFCVGGSTTYGRPYDDTTSFSGWLRAFLPEVDDSRNWEVINAGGISYASYRVAKLMEELARYDPDLFVVYTGHNEFLEERTYGSIKQLPSVVRNVGALLDRTRIFTLVKRIARQSMIDRGGNSDPRSELSNEVSTRLDEGVGPDAYQRDDPFVQDVLAHYRFNLNRIVKIARAADAMVVLVTPASNLSDCSPFKSQFQQTTPQKKRYAAQLLLDRAQLAMESGQVDEALATIDQAIAVDDRYAHLHYIRGKALLATGRVDEAKAAFVRARDEDVCPLRALTSIRPIVLEVAKQMNVPVVDYVQVLTEQSTTGIPGEELFLDHVHPTIDGNRILALELIDVFIRQGIARPISSWSEKAQQRIASQVKSNVDSTAQGIALGNLAKVLTWAGKSDEAHSLALQAVELVSGDSETHYLAAGALMAQGKIAEAVKQYRLAVELDPDYMHAHHGLGVAYKYLRQSDKAIASLKKAIELDPGFAPAYSNLGTVYQSQQRMGKAIELFKKAIRLNPKYASPRNNLGTVLLLHGDFAQAKHQLQWALRINPNLAEAHFNLGRVFAKQKEYNEALDRFRLALVLKPSYAPARVAMAKVLMKAGKHLSAVEHLQVALKGKRPPLDALQLLAWILATSDDDHVRNGSDALRLALAGAKTTQYKDPHTLTVLAAAQAEVGDFDSAIRWQKKAIELAEESVQQAYRGYLKRFRRREPIRIKSLN